MSAPRLPWPTAAEPLPLASLRPVLDRLSSLATRHGEDVQMIPGAALAETEVAADPPPALEQLTDELGGVRLRELPLLTLQIEERTDVGPYTLLGEPTSFYPLYETPDAAVILTLDEHGAPGAVYGIGEDLALQLAAPDLPTYLNRFTDALERTLTALTERGPAAEDSADARTDAAEQFMDEHLFAALLGMRELADMPQAAPCSAEQVADAAEVAGALAIWDLRGAALGTRVDLMDTDTPGDPLALHVRFGADGLVVTLQDG